MLKQIFGFLFILLATTNIQSQDIRGSEIKYSNPTNQTCNFEISLYVQSGMGIDRDTLMFENTIVPGILLNSQIILHSGNILTSMHLREMEHIRFTT
ncbi:MAG: hypothetical protein IPP27_14385 [Bacteroidetes bacterium]|nr:hypothetical protein [Bacteroidota bacterium]